MTNTVWSPAATAAIERGPMTPELTPEQKIELFKIVKGIGPENRLQAHEDLRDAFKQMGLDLPEFDVRSKLVTEYLAGTKKKLHHSRNPVLTPAVPVTQEYPRRDLKGLYPGFTIDGRGDVWMPNGERAPTRFRRKQEWVYLYDAANHRKERSVYWLMELVGFVDESKAKKPRSRAPAWAAFYNSLDEAHGEDAESYPNPDCRKKCCAGLN